MKLNVPMPSVNGRSLLSFSKFRKNEGNLLKITAVDRHKVGGGGTLQNIVKGRYNKEGGTKKVGPRKRKN